MRKPEPSVTSMAPMIFTERSANQSVSRMADIMRMPIGSARSATLANSSSAIGTGPVSRTETPVSGVS